MLLCASVRKCVQRGERDERRESKREGERKERVCNANVIGVHLKISPNELLSIGNRLVPFSSVAFVSRNSFSFGFPF